MKIADGPFVLTDLHVERFTSSSFLGSFFVVAGHTCPDTPTVDVVFTVSDGLGTYADGARYFVPSNSSLCYANTFGSQQGLSWAGFVPY